MIKIVSITKEIRRIEFKDELGNNCILAESLNKKRPKIHLGISQTLEGDIVPQMVLTPNVVMELLPFLLKFAEENKLFDNIETMKGISKTHYDKS